MLFCCLAPHKMLTERVNKNTQRAFSFHNLPSARLIQSMQNMPHYLGCKKGVAFHYLPCTIIIICQTNIITECDVCLSVKALIVWYCLLYTAAQHKQLYSVVTLSQDQRSESGTPHQIAQMVAFGFEVVGFVCIPSPSQPRHFHAQT